MNKRLLTVIGFSLCVAAAATLLLYSLISSRLHSGAPAAPAQQIVVASRDLHRGELLKDSDIGVVRWGTSILPKGSFTDKSNVVGRGVLAEVATGEPVLESHLAPREAGAGLAPAIPIGKRAVSVRVNEVVGVAGYVLPGSRVDVLVTGNAPGQNQQGPEIRTVLQNVEVLSAGTNIQHDAEGKPVQVPVVTLLVTPEEAGAPQSFGFQQGGNQRYSGGSLVPYGAGALGYAGSPEAAEGSDEDGGAGGSAPSAATAADCRGTVEGAEPNKREIQDRGYSG